MEELVASYRKALIVHAYQEELVNQQLGYSIDDPEIKQYYQQNPTLFRATQPYVQGLFIKVPVKVRIWAMSGHGINRTRRMLLTVC